MRLWSLHPRYLDGKGLVALWREALLAQAVLSARTRGYKKHPQLQRFAAASDPLAVIGAYLQGIWEEGAARGYGFDRRRICKSEDLPERIPVTRGQLLFERDHLAVKLARRDPARLQTLEEKVVPDPHTLFLVVDGVVEPWEKVRGT